MTGSMWLRIRTMVDSGEHSNKLLVKFQFLMVASMKMTTLWDIEP
jgi:hypothetical protein